MRDLSLHILDLVQNAVEAGAKDVWLSINEDALEDTLTIVVQDNGCGMDEQTVEAIKSPFATSRNTRKVGLGIPLIDMSTKASDGRLEIESKKGVGTKITAVYRFSHIDRPPLGDIATTVKIIVLSYQQINFFYEHKKNNKCFELDTKQIRVVLGEQIDFNDIEVRKWLTEYIASGLSDLSN